MALVHPEKVTDADVRDALASLTKGLRVRPTSSCGSLPPGGTIAPAFYPKPVIVRTSDLKTNEYASLLF